MIKAKSKVQELRAKFRAFYEESLKEDYQLLEPERQKYLSRFYKTLYVVVGLSFLLGGIFVNAGEMTENDWRIFVGFLYVFGCAVALSKPFSDYKKQTKKLVMNKMLAFWGDFKYKNQDPMVIALDTLKKSDLFYFDKRTADDSFEGTFENTKIKVSEQHITKEVRTKNGKRDATVFKGILIELKMPKQFSGQTVVKKKMAWGIKIFLGVILGIFALVFGNIFFITIYGVISGELSFFSEQMFGAIFQIVILAIIAWTVLKNRKKRVNVALEDVVFMKKWNVSSTNQVEARVILTPAFMERMLEVKRRFKGKDIEFSFWEDKVLIAVSTSDDMFETTSLFTPALDYKKVAEVVEQFYSVFSVAELLKK